LFQGWWWRVSDVVVITIVNVAVPVVRHLKD
jgi:hypothetical protein